MILIWQDGIVKIQFLHSVSVHAWEQGYLEIQMPSLWEIPVFDIYFIKKKPKKQNAIKNNENFRWTIN